MKEGSQIKRWTAARKREVVLRILNGESLNALSRELGIEIYLLEEWRSKAMEAMLLGLKSHYEDPIKEELDKAKMRIGELLMANELLQIKADRAPAFRMGRLRK